MNRQKRKVKGSYTVEALIVIPVILTVTLAVCGIMRCTEKLNKVMTACSASSVKFNNCISVLNAAGLESVMQTAAQGGQSASADTLDLICSLADLSDVNSASYDVFQRNGADLYVTNDASTDSAEVKARLARIRTLMTGFTQSDVTALISRAYKTAYDNCAAYLVPTNISVSIDTNTVTGQGNNQYYTISVKAKIPLVFGIAVEKSFVTQVIGGLDC